MEQLTLSTPFINPVHLTDSVTVQCFESDYYSDKTKTKLSTNLISFIIEGRKEIYYDNLSQKIGNNQFILAKSGNCLMSEKLSENQKYSCLLFYFTKDYITQFQHKHNIYNSSINLEVININLPFIAFEYDSFIKNFVNSLYQLLQLKPNTPKDFLQLKLEEILLYLIQKYGVAILHFFTLSNLKLPKKNSNLSHIVENNICSKLTLEELAFLCHMSLSTFKRQFKKTYKMSPSKWIQEQRLKKSTILLTQHKQRPSDIYHKVGYESLSSFTQSFKQKYGVTPNQFKQQKEMTF